MIMLYAYLSIAALVIFLIYNIVSLILFGVPTSLSETYYKYEEKHKNLGKFLFYTMLMVVGLLVVVATIDKAQVFSWLMIIGVAMVGVFPDYNNNTAMDKVVHPIGAAIAGAACLVSLFVMLPPIPAVIAICGVLILVLLFALITKSLKRSFIYHLEMVAFYSIFAGSIIYNLFYR